LAVRSLGRREEEVWGDGAADGGVWAGTFLFQPLLSTILKNKVKNKKKIFSLENIWSWKGE
jgi:hypothetical protein